MRNWLPSVKAWLKVEKNLEGLIRDLHVYGGIILMAAGTAAMFPPAALILSGVFLAWLGLRVPRAPKSRR